MSQQRLLVVCRQPPYGSSLAREALDMALAAAAFEQQVALYFSGDGVWQLLPDQAAEAIGEKNLNGILAALPLYDIESLYVDQRALTVRGLNLDHLATSCEAINPDEFSQLCHQFDVVLNF